MASILDDPIELRHLRYFRAVAQAGGMTRAALEVGVSQPTLSHQIAQLEKHLGVTLLVRGRHECTLTDAGELVLQYARRLLGDMEALRRSLDETEDLRRGHLRLGINPLFCNSVVPEVLKKFRLAYPNVRIQLLDMDADEMAKALASGQIEAGLGPIGDSVWNKGIDLFDDELLVILKEDDPLTEKKAISPAQLAGQGLIVAPAGYGTRTLLLTSFSRARRVPKIAVETISAKTVLDLTRADGTRALFPSSLFWGLALNGITLRRTTVKLHRKVGYLLPQALDPSPASREFLRMFREELSQTGVCLLAN